ncbi:MAG: SgcJ/EcaC family oxidoreductase [Alphaproteobacteria bacterium]|nr:SgcJ/EcaC family oxidoreductase [Alphaproteobacteria bacterium]
MRHARALLLAWALAGCDVRVALAASANQVGDAIRAQEAAMMAAIVAEDAAAIAEFYALDAQMLSPGVTNTTPAAIRAAFQRLLDDPNGTLRFQSSHMIIPASGDYAVSQGTYWVTYSDRASHQRASQSGNYINLWRRQQDGSWKIIRDITAPAPVEKPNP